MLVKTLLMLHLILRLSAAYPETIYGENGCSVIFICPYKSTSANSVTWFFLNNTKVPVPISDGSTILPLSSPHPRASIVGDHTTGVYNLNMSNLQDSDTGVYRCSVGSNQQEYKLELIGLCIADPEFIYGKKEDSVILICPYKSTSANSVTWAFVNNTVYPFPISDGTTILPFRSPHPRAFVVGDHTAGVYNLNMSGLQESDEGVYRCTVGSNQQKEYKLELLAAPTLLSLQDVTVDNKILGIEGQSLTLNCTATGGQPPPLVTIAVDNVTRSSEKTVEYTITTLQRRHDKQMIHCNANNSALSSPLVASAALYLYLKPMQPILSSDPITAEETDPLVLSCTTTGSRPVATFQWTIGLANVTFDSTTQFTHEADDTYTVTSTLNHTVNRIYNRQTIMCTAVNVAASYGVQTSKILNVKFAPYITVRNVNYTQNTASRTISCMPLGNPTTYTYYRWKHKSTYGELVRELNGGQDGILTLPSVPVEDRYQDSGEYVCTASNGITGKDGRIQQTGSGYITVHAQPAFTRDNKETEYVEFGKEVEIHVHVYSVPKYTSLKWYNSNTPISNLDKYAMSEMGYIVTDIFHGTEVKVYGFRISLTVKNCVESDFNVSYNIELSNGVGQPVRHNTLLIIASPPQTPINLTVTIASEASIKVQWEAGFNGGLEQIFYLEYRRLESKTWIAVKIQDSKQTGMHTYTISELQYETFYELRMYAENKLNKSLPTTTKTINTIKDSKFSALETVNKGVVGGLSSVIAIQFIIIIVLLKIRRKWTDKKKQTEQSSRCKDETSYIIPINCNEAYEEADVLSDKDTKTITGSSKEYETLGVMNNSNTYSELLSRKGLKQKSAQEYETIGVKDNVNTYSELGNQQDQTYAECKI